MHEKKFLGASSLILLAIITLAFSLPLDFLTEQKRFERVRTAITKKQDIIEKKLKTKALTLHNFNTLFIAYKDSDELEVYVKHKDSLTYQKIESYGICAKSGQLGPKRKQGDYQVPEGFYYINRFNPTSTFLLSLGINYPNASDRIKGHSSNLGGDIFIHGACVTIGCLPMTNSQIQELYLFAIHARNNGQLHIPVYIFPFKMTQENMAIFRTAHISNNGLIRFWTNLKLGYDKFVSEQKALQVKILKNGDYHF
ncbi:MAG: L,D-transpeptidase family protein [Putridiphycobacter sp.]|nr:L,D-transpeptidase family protein [Putridiphycobacter sp.]